MQINIVEFQNAHFGKKSPRLSNNDICLEGISYLYPICTTKNDMVLYLCCVQSFSHVQLCDTMDCSQPDSSVHGDCPGKNIGVGCYALLQGIFPTLRLNPGFPHCRQIYIQEVYSKSGAKKTIMTNVLSVIMYRFSLSNRYQGIDPFGNIPECTCQSEHYSLGRLVFLTHLAAK